MEEIWKDIEGYEGKYQISSFGRFKNVKFNKINKCGMAGRGVLYKLSSIGYVHIFVAHAFVPNPHNKPEVGHLDNNSLNNYANNLNWCTHSENQQNSKNNLSKSKQGQKHYHAKLTDKQALDIIQMRKQKIRYKVIAQKYNVTENSLVSLVTRGWNYLKHTEEH